jgi:Clathrin adaptor complex small chain
MPFQHHRKRRWSSSLEQLFCGPKSVLLCILCIFHADVLSCRQQYGTTSRWICSCAVRTLRSLLPVIFVCAAHREDTRVSLVCLTMDSSPSSPSSSSAAACGWNFIVLMSRQGKIRLSEFFSSYSESEKRRILRDIAVDVLPRQPKMCNIIEKGTYKFVYRRYASLYFVAGVPTGMNELIVLEQIHLFVEALDSYFR